MARLFGASISGSVQSGRCGERSSSEPSKPAVQRTLDSQDSRADSRRIGLIAGWGRLPVVVAEAVCRSGRDVVCLGILGHADPKLREICREFRWLGLGQMGAAVKHFRRRGVRELTMAGKVFKTQLFQPWFWFRQRPDWFTIRAFARHFLWRRADCRDDSLLGRVVEVFEKEGLSFQPATDYLPELLVPPGQLSARRPNARQRQDISFGWEIAKQIGRMDIGQAVAVKDGTVLAVEAIEGTDECIRRAGTLCEVGGFTVVKVAKPQQDMRFDVPTVGLRTLETMVAAKAEVLAVEAGKTIFLDAKECLEFADRHRLIIVALSSEDLSRPEESTP